jgi:hypothetical protein
MCADCCSEFAKRSEKFGTFWSVKVALVKAAAMRERLIEEAATRGTDSS